LRPGPACGLFAAAEDARADVDEDDLSAAVDDDDARAAVDDEDARAAVDDYAAVVTAGESMDLDRDFVPTVFQSSGKKRTKDKSKNTGLVRPGVLFRVIGGAH